MISHSETLEPLVDSLGRWQWPDPDCECVRMMRRAGRFRVVLTTWLEQQIEALVDLPQDVIQQAENPVAIRQERMRRFREASFGLHVEEHFSRTKRKRDRIIYSMLRCQSNAPSPLRADLILKLPARRSVFRAKSSPQSATPY